jgi:hypothetical protein
VTAAQPNRRRILQALAPDRLLGMLHTEIDCFWTDELDRPS